MSRVRPNLFNAVINLDNHVYFPGETVNGSVSFDLDERLKIENLKVALEGNAKIRWSRTRSDRKFLKLQRRLEYFYKAVENFINEEKPVMTQPAYHDLNLEAGEHNYKFRFVLPKTLPSSFEHPYGRIRYKILAIIKFPLSLEVPIYRSFTVLSPFNLNFFPNLQMTDSLNVTKPMRSCCCVRNGNLTSTLTILRGGYVCGESIIFSLNIQNNSNKVVKYANVRLMQKVSIQNKIALREVAAYNVPQRIAKRSSRSVYDARLPIPAVCPTSNEKSKLIKVNYFLLLSFKSPRRRVKPRLDEITIPIVIGTVPFHNDPALRLEDSRLYDPCVFGAHFKRTKVSNTAFNQTNEIDFRPLYPTYDDPGHIGAVSRGLVNYSYV